VNNKNVLKRLLSRGIFPHQWSFILLFQIRNIFLSPKKLIARLEIGNDSRVLELGPGPGFFSTEVAKRLVKGRLILADIQQEMLDCAKRRLEKRELRNVDYYLCNGESFDFNDNSLDIVFMAAVIGEVENKEAYMKEFYRMLKTGGFLSISEIMCDPDKMTIDEIRCLALKHNFNLHKVYGNNWNFTINFIK
jgi:ubiquinone/menaquinone biosynthesis C-methylase UbiE